MKIGAYSALIAIMAVCGCQSGLYKISTSEDGKKFDDSVRYCEIDSSADSFIKGNGSSPEGTLYDEDCMPIQIVDGRSDKHYFRPLGGWTGVLWMFSLGIFPICDGESVIQEISIKSPIGVKAGSYCVDARRWGGWIPIFIGYPAFADERDDDADLPNVRIEQAARDRLVKSLVGEFSFTEYVAFAKKENTNRKTELARIQSVSENIDRLIGANKFDDAFVVIGKEAEARPGMLKCDEGKWSEMSNRVAVAHQAFDKKRAQTLIDSGKYEDAIAFCATDNALSLREKEVLTEDAVKKGFEKLKKEVSTLVDDYIAKNMFTEAEVLIKKESHSPMSRRKGDIENEWLEMIERISAARRRHEKELAETFIASGKYEEAIAFCDSENSLSPEVNLELKRNAIEKVVKEVKDPNRLVAVLKLINDVVMRDDIVMRLMSLNAGSALAKDHLVEILNTTEREEVALAVVGIINDKDILVSLVDKPRTVNVMRALLAKIADADAVRSKIWNGGDETARRAYVLVYGSDDECLKLIMAYPNILTDAVIKELKEKISREETKLALEELQINRLVAGEEDEVDKVVDRIKRIPEQNIRSKIAFKTFNLMAKDEKLNDLDWYHVDKALCYWCGYIEYNKLSEKEKFLNTFVSVVRMVSEEDLGHVVSEIRNKASSTIHFEGYYVGMSVSDYVILCSVNKWWPEYYSNDNCITYISIGRQLRYKLFEKEDGEFWSAFMRKYIPSGKKKSLGEVLDDALDMGTYDYQTGYDDKCKEVCYIYKSIKYSTRVLFGQESGTLVLEKFW